MNMETATVTFFLMTTRHGVFFSFDGWLMFDGLQYTCLFDVVATPFSRSVNVFEDYSEIRDSRCNQ